MFAKPKKVEAVAAPKSRIVGKVPTTVKGLARLAALKTLLANVETMIEAEEAGVRKSVLDILIANGKKSAKKPDSIYVAETGEGFNATANATLRRRASNSVISEEEAEILTANGIPFEIMEKTPEMLAVNPEHAGNAELLAKVDRATAKLGLPEDFIIMIPAETKKVATDESVDKLFSGSFGTEAIEELIPLVSVPTLGRYKVSDSAAAVKAVEKMINEEVFKRVRVPAGTSKKAA
jgi:hypothetical protein